MFPHDVSPFARQRESFGPVVLLVAAECFSSEAVKRFRGTLLNSTNHSVMVAVLTRAKCQSHFVVCTTDCSLWRKANRLGHTAMHARLNLCTYAVSHGGRCDVGHSWSSSSWQLINQAFSQIAGPIHSNDWLIPSIHKLQSHQCIQTSGALGRYK